MNPLAIALQGIGFSALLVAAQGFAPYQAQTTGPSKSPQGQQIDRQWLIEYYTKQFSKPKAEKPKGKPLTVKKAQIVEAQRQQQIEAKVQKAVAKASADLEKLTADIADTQAAHQFIADLRLFVTQSTKTIVDFIPIGLNYRQSRSGDDDLLLFAVGMHPPTVHRPIAPADGDLLLLMHVL